MATPPINPSPSKRTHAIVTVSTAADGTSDMVDLTGLTLSSIQVTSVGWTAASIGFKASVDGTTVLFDVFDSAGNNLTFPATASRVIAFSPDQFAGIQKLQLVSETTAGVAVAQGADRIVKLGLSKAHNPQ